MEQNPLASLDGYSRFVAALVERPTVLHSTLVVWSTSPYTGVAEGEVLFPGGLKLCVLEELDFEAHLVTGYSYEVHHHGEKLYWYDDYPHPHDPDLAVTHPHHKHIPPDIKHHRVPATGHPLGSSQSSGTDCRNRSPIGWLESRSIHNWEGCAVEKAEQALTSTDPGLRHTRRQRA